MAPAPVARIWVNLHGESPASITHLATIPLIEKNKAAAPTSTDARARWFFTGRPYPLPHADRVLPCYSVIAISPLKFPLAASR